MGDNMKLTKLIETLNYPTDKSTLHSYIPIYDVLFEEFSDKQINFLEIGIQYGASIKLWRDYFTKATIFGYDIEDKAEMFPEGAIKVIKDANLISPTEFINNPLNIAIDDGSHTLTDQLNFVKNIYPQMADGGLLIIEDIQNIDQQNNDFKTLNIPYTIIDLRNVQGRYDDVILIFRK